MVVTDSPREEVETRALVPAPHRGTMSGDLVHYRATTPGPAKLCIADAGRPDHGTGRRWSRPSGHLAGRRSRDARAAQKSGAAGVAMWLRGTPPTPGTRKTPREPCRRRASSEADALTAEDAAARPTEAGEQQNTMEQMEWTTSEWNGPESKWTGVKVRLWGHGDIAQAGTFAHHVAPTRPAMAALI